MFGMKINSAQEKIFIVKNSCKISVTEPSVQCCGSGMISSRILDPAKIHSGSRILLYKKKGHIFKTAPKAFLMS
jgi:hypothetical protein